MKDQDTAALPSTSSQTSGRRRSRVRGLAMAVLATAAALTGAASAQATVTSSSITTPSDPYFDFYDGDSSDPQEFHVAGTSDGTTGDFVDIVCYAGGSTTTLADDVAVAADGTFSVQVTKPAGDTCQLRAVDGAGITGALVNYPGPVVGFGYYEDFSTPGGLLWSYLTETSTRSAYSDIYSAGDGGLYSSALYDASFQEWSGNWRENASFYQQNFFRPGSSVVLDGFDAYTPGETFYINDDAPGMAEIGLERSFDPLTGQWTVVETNPLVFCSTDGTTPVDVGPTYPSAVTCPEWIPAGVTLVRTVTQAHDGRQVRFADSWRSTDGASHDFAVYYQNELNGWTSRFPGEGTHSEHAAGTSVALGQFPVGTMYTQLDQNAIPGVDNIQGAMTWLTAPTRAVFEDPGEFVLQFDRTIPAGGSTEITQVYSEAFTREDVTAMAEGAEDATEAPVVAISAPANGAAVGSDGVTVIGTASDNIGVTSLTVNGIATPVGEDGSWSQRVALAPGANTITAIAEDGSGNTGQAQVSVTHTPAAGSCTVPNVVGQTEGAASAALVAAGCSVGDIARAPSRTVARGSVISQGNAAGQKVSSFFPVPLVISSGPVARASLVGKTLRLKGRRISMQVRCPATAGDVCNGTLKLRTSGRLGGAKRTLGTKSFQAPPGARRRTTLRVSRANARRIHRAGRVKALAFIVMRDEDGKARTTRTRITIRG